jgi:hypothetical protein
MRMDGPDQEFFEVADDLAVVKNQVALLEDAAPG